MKKEALRKLYKQKRKTLSSIEIDELQSAIYEQIFQYDFSQEKYVHIFLPILRHKEINTYPIIAHLRKLDKIIVISKSDFKTNTLQHYIYEQDTTIVVNDYGIPEPVDAKVLAVEEIDLVFVPLLISDQKNYRVGYGKGFYDRFLSECKTDVKTIGLNFFKPIVQIEDITTLDVALDQIIYPT